MLKNIAIALIIVGVLTLLTGILVTFSVGGAAALILIIASIIINSVGITLLREK